MPGQAKPDPTKEELKRHGITEEAEVDKVKALLTELRESVKKTNDGESAKPADGSAEAKEAAPPVMDLELFMKFGTL